ncbi:MAG: D-alanine--D-alanine ligase [Clostridia bacterium]|nr:D-alanine--D-alanine ligase [Clostridia bacterium]
MERKNIRLAVVYGGISSEREISLRSGAAIYEALKRGGYTEVSLFDLKRDNLGELLALSPELVFLALHGKGGEDGCIQGMLELAGIPYTGSSVEASATCMNKIHTKEILVHGGIPTPKFITLYRSEVESEQDAACTLLKKIGIPMVLKAPCQGSSIGVRIVKKREELEDAIREVFAYDAVLLAEKFMEGTELTLPILGNRHPRTLPIVEITSENEFYDYEAKYTQGMCRHIIPARIDASIREKVEAMGTRAYIALGCSGLARIDFMLDSRGDPMIIEVNTLPGMTEMSLFPDSARYAGISFEALVDQIVTLAWEKTKEDS